MNLQRSLFLFLAFLFTVSLAYADRTRPDRTKEGTPVVCPANKEYNVGDRGPANGWIIYKKPAPTGKSADTCWQYLEAAPYDQEKPMRWSHITDRLIGGTSTEVGKGKENTQKIRAQTDYSPTAAKSCNDLIVKYDGQTFEDWFLPSRDELDLMYQLLAKDDNKGGFKTKYDGMNTTAAWYWSSSEVSPSYAWFKNFTRDYNYRTAKSTDRYVRCVRAF